MNELLAVALGGAAGSLGRFGLHTAAQRLLGTSFPYGTLAVNVAGGFLLSLVMQAGAAGGLSRPLQLALAVGFLGAFTTFSTFSYETIRLIESGALLTATANILANVVLALLGTWAGLAAARSLWPSA